VETNFVPSRLSLDPSASSRISLPCRQGRSRSPKNAELIGFNRSCRTRLPPTKLPLSLDPRQFVWLRPIAQSFVDRTSIISKSFNSGPSLRPVKPGQQSAFSGNNSTPTPQAVANVGEAASFCNPIGPAAHVFGSPFSPAPRKTGAKGRHLLFDSLRHERCRWRNELARAKPFATPSRHDRYFRIPTVWNRRKGDIARPASGRLNWAESEPTGVAPGRTGVRAIAVIPWGARKGFIAIAQVPGTAIIYSSHTGSGRDATPAGRLSRGGWRWSGQGGCRAPLAGKPDICPSATR
jgi:hypothetical protein